MNKLDKVYIVTSGCYSDYKINKVFIDKEKAENYKELIEKNGIYHDVNDIEEYEIEQKIGKSFIIFRFAVYIRNGNVNTDFFSVSKEYRNNLDVDIKICNKNYYWYKDRDFRGSEQLAIYRPIYEINIKQEEKIIEKYKKVLFDLYAKIKSLKEIEGWDDKMIKEWVEKGKL